MSSQMGQAEGALSSAAAKVVDCKTDLDGLAKNLRSQLGNLSTQWQGQGGAAFGKLAMAWDERQRTIVEALNGFEESLRQTEKDNVSTDEQESSTINALASRLDDKN